MQAEPGTHPFYLEMDRAVLRERVYVSADRPAAAVSTAYRIGTANNDVESNNVAAERVPRVTPIHLRKRDSDGNIITKAVNVRANDSTEAQLLNNTILRQNFEQQRARGKAPNSANLCVRCVDGKPEWHMAALENNELERPLGLALQQLTPRQMTTVLRLRVRSGNPSRHLYSAAGLPEHLMEVD